MATFSDQVASLAESVTTSRRDCALAVRNIKEQTTGMMSDCARARRDMGRQLKAGLAAGASARTEQVNAMRRAHREEQRRAGRELRRGLTQTTDRIAGSVASFRKSFSKQCAAMAKAQQAQFSTDRKARVTDCAERSLACAMMLTGMTQSHQAMARQLRGTLRANTAEICSDVAKLKRGFNATQGALRDDLQAARQIWRSRGVGATTATAAVRKPMLGPVEGLGNAFSELGGGTPAAEPQAEPKLRKSWGKLSDEEKVLQVMQRYPHGVSAASIGEKVSLHAGAVGKIMKELMEQGAIRRDASTRLYFSAK